MRKKKWVRRGTQTVLAFCMLLATSSALAQVPKKSVREGLAEQQRAGGYSLVDPRSAKLEVLVVSVMDRTTRSAGKNEKIARYGRTSPDARWELVDRKDGLRVKSQESGAEQIIDANGSCGAQCWSPDGQQFVYSAGGIIRVYNLQERKVVKELGRGSDPHWSPDGKWIAFDDGQRLILIAPTGEERKRLFKTKNIYSQILWSPDSRFLSYTKLGGPTGGFLF